MKLGTINQQPGERISWTLQFSDALTGDDIIVAGVVKSITPATANPAGPALVVDQLTPVDTRLRFWVSGGVHLGVYKITFTTTSKDGDVFEDEVTVKVKEL